MIIVKRQFMSNKSIDELITKYNITTKKRKYKGNETVRYLSEDTRPETIYILYNLNNDIEDDISDEEDDTTNLPFTEKDKKIVDDIIKGVV